MATTYAEAARNVRKAVAHTDHKAAADTQAGVPAPRWAAAGFAGPIVCRPTSAGPAGRSGEDTISGRDTIREAALQQHCPYRLLAADSSRRPFPPARLRCRTLPFKGRIEASRGARQV
jgi:hypothetical protein